MQRDLMSTPMTTKPTPEWYPPPSDKAMSKPSTDCWTNYPFKFTNLEHISLLEPKCMLQHKYQNNLIKIAQTFLKLDDWMYKRL